MQSFDFVVAERIEDAFFADGDRAMPIAGGTELLNWFRLGIAAPDQIIDLGRIGGMNAIEERDSRLYVGALATLNEVGEHPAVVEHAAVLSQACLAAASPQIRNRATIGGNVLQKTRCAYFRAEAPLPWPCNKREPGTGCAAREGLNERHAIFGWTDACVATHPSDPIVALAALGAEVDVEGRDGRRSMAVADFCLSQEEASAAGLDAARAENRLQSGEIIVGYSLPIRPGARSAYVKVRERASYEYALVSAAVVLTVQDRRIGTASVVLGSVAQKPWRLEAAEGRLVGLAPTREAVLPVLKESLGDARPLAQNRFKIAMAAGAAARAITAAGEKA